MNGTAVQEIRREKVYVPTGMSTREIMNKYGIKEKLACKVRKKGWFVKNYSKKQVIVDPEKYNVDIAYSIARKIYKQNFSRRPLAWSLKDDLIQEAVTRMYKLSGRYKDNGKYGYVRISQHKKCLKTNAIRTRRPISNVQFGRKS